MRTLFDPQEALTNARTLLKTPQRFREWLSTDPDRLFRADRRSGTNALVRFLTEARVAGVHQGTHHIYVGMNVLELPAWAEHLKMPHNRGFLARYLIWRLEEETPKEAA